MALSANQKATRDLIDYYVPPPRPGWRNWLTVSRLPWRYQLWRLAAVSVIACALANWMGWGQERHSPGPVAAAHAPWGGNCAVCHEARAEDSPGRPARLLHLASDRRCAECHVGHHHQDCCEGLEEACTRCHWEHRGREA